MNEVQLIGRLTRDVVLKTFDSGMTIASFTLAVSNGIGKDGNKLDPEYINIKCFGKHAEVCAKYLTKGYLVCVVGKLHTGSYKHKTYDIQIPYAEITARHVDFLKAPKEKNIESIEETSFENVNESDVTGFEGGDINEQES